MKTKGTSIKRTFTIITALLLAPLAALHAGDLSDTVRVETLSKAVPLPAKNGADKGLTNDLPPFVPPAPNRVLSPYTGMDRSQWLACGRHILKGVFQHVDRLETPLLLPKLSAKSRPPEHFSRLDRSIVIFEALARTLNIAAPLIRSHWG